jgi:hypothetical protein
MIKNIKMLFLVSLTFVACTTKEEEVIIPNNSSDGLPLTAGSANFSKYVAVGNSLTAGFSDGALFIEGQKTSWTAILAEQFKLVGGGEYKIPFMGDNLGGFSAGGIQFPQTGVRTFWNGCAPTAVAGISSTVLGASIAANGPYNNCGIPGAKCIDLVNSSFVASSPYFARIITPTTPTVLDYAKNQSPTFFSLWIGNNDVLSYALAGGDSSPGAPKITPSAGAIGIGFDESYTEIVNKLIGSGNAKGVIANIPYVTTIPNFTTVTIKPFAPYRIFEDVGETTPCKVYPVSPADIASINTLNSDLLGPIKQILSAYGQGDRIQLLSTTENNPLLINDESLTSYGAEITGAALASPSPTLNALANYLGAVFGRARHTKPGDLIPLASSGAIGTNATLPTGVPTTLGKRGVSYPLEDKFVLVPSEILELKNATDAFNITIQGIATAKGLAFVDANKILSDVATKGVVGNGFTVKSDYVTGGGFSLDGVHPSPRGYALIANAFLKEINKTYGSNFKPVDLGKYKILFPSSL